MPKGYWMAHIRITDAANYPPYREAAGKAIAAYGGRFLVRAGRYELPEGPGYDRNVIVEFDSYERAVACYHSPEYRAAAKLRLASSESTFTIVEGAD
jgi:uncharacterized protein (DUF1330 family)